MKAKMATASGGTAPKTPCHLKFITLVSASLAKNFAPPLTYGQPWYKILSKMVGNLTVG